MEFSTTTSNQNEVLDVEAISQFNIEDIINSYTLQLLQSCDQKQLPKNVKYLSALLLRSILSQEPLLISQHQVHEFTFICAKVVLQKFGLQESMGKVNAFGKENQINENFLQSLESKLKKIIQSPNFLIPTPYDFLNELKISQKINQKMMKGVLAVLDFCLTLPSITTTNSKCIFLASLQLYMDTYSYKCDFLQNVQDHILPEKVALKQKLFIEYLNCSNQL